MTTEEKLEGKRAELKALSENWPERRAAISGTFDGPDEIGVGVYNSEVAELEGEVKGLEAACHS
jgi:hypothetical protein